MHPRSSGFTLIEVAIVLTILAMLAGGLLVPLSDSLERSRRNNAEQELREQILPALLGFSASTPDVPHLPCPDCRRNGGGNCPGGGTAGDGEEDRDGDACAVAFGALPWATLGLAATDPWGSRYSYGVFADYADADVDKGVELSDNDPDLYITRGTLADFQYAVQSNGVAAVVLSHGPNHFGAMAGNLDSGGDPILIGNPPASNDDERENLDGDNKFVMRPPADPTLNSSVEEFDDIVVWLSSYRLRGFLVDAGRLP